MIIAFIINTAAAIFFFIQSRKSKKQIEILKAQKESTKKIRNERQERLKATHDFILKDCQADLRDYLTCYEDMEVAIDYLISKGK